MKKEENIYVFLSFHFGWKYIQLNIHTFNRLRREKLHYDDFVFRTAEVLLCFFCFRLSVCCRKSSSANHLQSDYLQPKNRRYYRKGYSYPYRGKSVSDITSKLASATHTTVFAAQTNGTFPIGIALSERCQGRLCCGFTRIYAGIFLTVKGSVTLALLRFPLFAGRHPPSMPPFLNGHSIVYFAACHPFAVHLLHL